MNVLRIVAICLALFALPASAGVMPTDFDAGRNRLLAYMLSHQLTSQHFAHKSLDDVSPAAFDLYLRQLDPRKRFLLQEDAQELRTFANRIDEDLRKGLTPLPDTGLGILTRRVKEVEIITEQLLDAGFDPFRIDHLETDVKKIEYASTMDELRDRWRRTLKMQALETYLDLLEKQKKTESADDQDDSEAGPPETLLPTDTINDSLWAEAMEKTRDRNRRFFARQLQETRQEHYNRFFDSVARAFDPHTSYMAPTSKEDFDIHMSGSLEGIGALLSEEDGNIKVVRIIPGSAAERHGQLQTEDVILAVAEKGEDPVDIHDMRIREAVSYIRGAKGTEVVLTIQKPDGAKKTISIVRDVVQIEETYIKSEVLENSEGQKIGYLRIPSFYRNFADSGAKSQSRNATRDMIKELHKLKNEDPVNGLIIDLRNNGGGSLSDAVTISGLFLAGGPIVQVKSSQGEIKVLDDTDKHIYFKEPVIILINKFSASASEILAAALQDYGRALVIGGDHTHGKGTVQTILDLNHNLPILHRRQYEDLGALKLTIQKFYRINGESTQYKGIEPDIVVPTTLDHLQSGEKYQDYSLPWDKIETVKFTPWQSYRFDVRKARQLSAQWIASSPEFNKIKERTAKAAERIERTTMPVHLEGAVKNRLELAELTRDDNGSPAHLTGSDESAGADDKNVPLREQLEEDPYVQLAVSLMNEMVPPSQGIKTSQ
ncbi:MAG: carboxy terminal-processing peptidase [Desulfobulbaceae bacterium]|nr:carboxy terminal-processing peptidase [Desulfobulbaceae bacterium]